MERSATMREVLAMNGFATVLAVVAVAAWACAAQARDIHIDHEKGDDGANGLTQGAPLKTIAQAITLAQPGDTIHLAPTKTPYKQSAVFHNKSGEPGKPIVLDGHGATLSGSEPLDEKAWQQVAPGLYRNDKLIPRSDAIVGRFYFIFDGQMNHMGRTSKGPKRPWLKPEELKPGEWTYVKDDHAFYVKIEPGKKLGDCRIESPARSNGVSFSGECNHFVIRNVIATHVWNDGYNIHGKTRDILFENITAIDCGDDGLSAHDDCEVRVEGFVSIGNSTGICNVGHSTSVNNCVLIKGCLGYDFFVLDTNTHTLTNSVIFANASRSVDVRGRADGGVCTLKMDNVAIIHTGEHRREIAVGKNGILEARRLTAYGLCLVQQGAATLTESVIGGNPAPEFVLSSEAKWQADKNVYDLKSLRLDKAVYAPKDFDAYRQATRQDAASQWTKIEFAQPLTGRVKTPGLPKGVGADLALLPLEGK
ncbi:MAG: DUF1565 domain-containing protein [Planctomycetes bacterium]|nr:DUF1565 domain-containing protein [Planctomycetota bacterium]MBM4086300.1 DUF1565 domain-containing protein [Planctomycetota bacterium]